MKVLLLEPDGVLAKSYVSAIHSAGHQAYWASSAQQAIELSDRYTPDVIVAEIQLAGHNSVEFLYELRSYPDWQHVPVVLNTLVPRSKLADVGKVLDLMGVTHCLYKPNTNTPELLRAIESVGDLVNA